MQVANSSETYSEQHLHAMNGDHDLSMEQAEAHSVKHQAVVNVHAVHSETENPEEHLQVSINFYAWFFPFWSVFAIMQLYLSTHTFLCAFEKLLLNLLLGSNFLPQSTLCNIKIFLCSLNWLYFLIQKC